MLVHLEQNHISQWANNSEYHCIISSVSFIEDENQAFISYLLKPLSGKIITVLLTTGVY